MSLEERAKWVEDSDVLVARWKYTSIFENASYRRSNVQINFQRKRLEFLSEAECTPSTTNQYVHSESDRRFKWRGETTFGGSYAPKDSRRGSPNPSKPPAKRESLAERPIPNLANFVDLSMDDTEEKVQGGSRHASLGSASGVDRGSIHRKHTPVKTVRLYTYGDGCKVFHLRTRIPS
jgi:hypothetical protein